MRRNRIEMKQTLLLLGFLYNCFTANSNKWKHIQFPGAGLHVMDNGHAVNPPPTRYNHDWSIDLVHCPSLLSRGSLQTVGSTGLLEFQQYRACEQLSVYHSQRVIKACYPDTRPYRNSQGLSIILTPDHTEIVRACPLPWHQTIQK